MVVEFLGIFIACGLTVLPWTLSLIATLLYQPSKKKALLKREQNAALSGDALSTLRKPLGNREIREYRVMMANVVMSPSWVQMFIGWFLSIFGGEINVYTKIVDWARREAKQRLREQVAEAGFDEVINMRIETSVLSKTSNKDDKTAGIEILAYGTAIKY